MKMPNTSILVPDIEKGETTDTPKKFKNIDMEDFEFSWDNVKTIIKVGETISLPLYKVNYAAMHLARKIYKRIVLSSKTEIEKKIGLFPLRNEEEEKKLQLQMVADNFEQVPQEPEIKAPELKPEPTPTPTIPTEEKTEEKKPEEVSWNCEICGFIAKNKVGLLAHKRFKHPQPKI